MQSPGREMRFFALIAERDTSLKQASPLAHWSPKATELAAAVITIVESIVELP